MKKKEYLKPAMRVVNIQHTGMLLTSGNRVTSKRTNYGKANNGVDIDELDDETGEWEWN